MQDTQKFTPQACTTRDYRWLHCCDGAGYSSRTSGVSVFEWCIRFYPDGKQQVLYGGDCSLVTEERSHVIGTGQRIYSLDEATTKGSERWNAV